MNYNTMTNNNTNNSKMNNNNEMNDSNKDSILVAEAVLCTPTQKHQPGTLSALYKLAARNLREYHGVPSMTALKLEKTVALLGLRPRRIVAQGLAPRRLLRGGEGGSSPLVLAGDSWGETGESVDENLLINSSSSSSEDEDEEEDDSNSTYDDNIHDNIGDDSSDDTTGDVEGSDADGNGYGDGKARRPIHAALVAGGINLRPRETRPLLCALGVSPHCLVKLGLVKREAVRTMAGGRGGGRGQHHRTGGPGKRGVGGPRGLSRGPPHALGGPSFGCGRSRPMLGPARRPFHGAGCHTMHLWEESKEEGMLATLGPHGGRGHRGPRHQRGCLQGPHCGPGHHHSMPTGRHGHGPTGGGKHGHGHRHPPCGHGHEHGHGHDGSGGLHGEGGGGGSERPLCGRARGPGQDGPRHRGRGVGGPRGQPHTQPGVYCCGRPSPRGGRSRPRPGPPRRPFYGAGHHALHLGEESEEEGILTPVGSHGDPGHRGPRLPGRGIMGEPRCCPRGPPHGPPHGPTDGPFHVLFLEEGVSGAPSGMMAHPRDGSPSREGGGGMKRRGGRHGGGTGFYGRRCGGGGGGGGERQHRRMVYLDHFDGRHQPRLKAY